MDVTQPFGGELIGMRNMIDLHSHPYPDMFPRLVDDYALAYHAREAGMRAVLLKCHHENTVSRAYHVQRDIKDMHVLGGIVLNSYVGHLNPAAVEASLRLGGKAVWMPTIDAGHHARVHGGTGGYDQQAGGRASSEGVWILDEDGNLVPEVLEIFELVAEHGAMLSTCHLSPREIVSLTAAAMERGIEKVVITHPYFKVPDLDEGTAIELARMGAYLEFGYCTVSPAWNYATPEKVVRTVEAVGPERCLLVSDTGQRHNPPPHEALRVFSQTLFEKGVALSAIEHMISRNPADLLNLPDAPLPRMEEPPPHPTTKLTQQQRAPVMYGAEDDPCGG